MCPRVANTLLQPQTHLWKEVDRWWLMTCYVATTYGEQSQRSMPVGVPSLSYGRFEVWEACLAWTASPPCGLAKVAWHDPAQAYRWPATRNRFCGRPVPSAIDGHQPRVCMQWP